MLAAVIFDLNGVIVDDERVHQESWRQLCKKYDVHISEEEFTCQVFGRTERETLAFLFRRELSEDELVRYSNERIKIATELYTPQLAMTRGLFDVLESLKHARIPIALATGSRIPYASFILDSLEIRHYFRVIITAEMVKCGKPNPEIYARAATDLHAEPKDCVVIEDSISGIRAGKAAGMKVLAIATTHAAHELELADRVIASFKEISVDDLRQIVG